MLYMTVFTTQYTLRVQKAGTLLNKKQGDKGRTFIRPSFGSNAQLHILQRATAFLNWRDTKAQQRACASRGNSQIEPMWLF